ncbi:MAG: trypsin-like peptidase domain-containing protein, partial [Candidatus Eremiobacterota bacterium]
FPGAAVRFYDNTMRKARVVRSSRRCDLALLQILDPPADLAYLSPDRIEVRYGEPVYAFGSPLQFADTLTRGVVSHPLREIKGVRYIQTDASVNVGNSGGPLVNEQGRLLGLNTWGVADATNLNFAVSVEHLIPWMETADNAELLQKGRYCVVCGWLNENAGKWCSSCGTEHQDHSEFDEWQPEQENADSAPAQAGEGTECATCHKNVPAGKSYCPHCGTRVG